MGGGDTFLRIQNLFNDLATRVKEIKLDCGSNQLQPLVVSHTLRSLNLTEILQISTMAVPVHVEIESFVGNFHVSFFLWI